MTAPSLPLNKTPLQRAKDAYNARAGNHELKLAAALIADDAWASGAGWNGPLPKPQPGQPATDSSNISRITTEIKREFVSRNMLDNLVTRHVHGIAGREPLQGFKVRRHLREGEKPNAQEQERINEYQQAYTNWWDNSGVWLNVQQALKNAVWSGKGTVRLFVPRSKLKVIRQENGQPVYGIPGGLSLADALGFISVHAPEWNQAGVLRDGDRRVTGAYYRYSDENQQDRWELMERVDEGGQTQTRVTPQATNAAEDVFTDYPVSDLLIFEVSLNPLIKSSIVTLAKFLNKTLTMGSRNINLGGFVERTIMNAQMPGKMVDGKFVPDAYEVGLGSTGYLAGLPIKKVDENTGRTVETGGYTTPSIQYKDPIQWEPTFGKTIESVREQLFDEAKQLHVLITGDATANGVSRQQAVNDFMTSLEPTRMALEQLLRWLMTTVLSLGLHFTGRLAEFEEFTATAQARASAVQPTTPEIEQALKLHEAGMISEETAMLRCGIEEVEQERARRQREGITPALAFRIAADAPAPFIAMQAFMLAFPALEIKPEHVAAQREIDLAKPEPAVDPAALDDPADDPLQAAD